MTKNYDKCVSLEKSNVKITDEVKNVIPASTLLFLGSLSFGRSQLPFCEDISAAFEKKVPPGLLPTASTKSPAL